jgi:hypothetical protein
MLTRTKKVIEPITGYRLPVTGLTPFIAGPLGVIAESQQPVSYGEFTI